MISRRPDMAQLLGAIGLPDGLMQRAEANVGSTITLDVTGRPGEAHLLLFATGTAEVNNGFGRMLLEQASVVVAGLGALPSVFSVAVPNNPALVQYEVYWQALRFDAALTTFRPTNSIVSHFER
jgi:hypothetical protein